MAYVTAQTIVDRIGEKTALELTTDTGSVVDTSVITAIINEVEPQVEAALRKRTSATITQAAYPETYSLIVGKVIDMVLFRLAAARRPSAPAEWKTLHELAIEWLKKLAAGEVDLPDTALNDPEIDWGSEDQNAAAQRG